MLLVVPLAIPDFVVSFGWASLSTAVTGFRGAVLVMTLAVYPLVYLPVAASLRNADPAQEEVARSLGAGRRQTFWRVTVGQARVAILGGCLLVIMTMLAEYGAFEILGYQTFTTEIFTEFSLSFNIPAACALSLVLVALGLVVLGGGRRSPPPRPGQPGKPHGAASHAAAPAGPVDRPRAALLAALVLLALGVPVGSAAYWWATGTNQPFTGTSLLSAAGYSAAYSGGAAALATVLALPVAVLAVRHGGRLTRAVERSTYLVLALPGLVIALSLSYFSERYGNGIGYQSAPMLVLAYAIMFFPLALVGLRASVAQAPGRPRGHRQVARPAAAGRVLAGDEAARHARPGRRVLPGVPLLGHRADRDPDPGADRRADPRHPVLELPAEPRLRPGSAVRPRDDRDRRDPELRARPVLRPSPLPRRQVRPAARGASHDTGVAPALRGHRAFAKCSQLLRIDGNLRARAGLFGMCTSMTSG